MPRPRQALKRSPDSVSDAVSPQSLKSFESGSGSRNPSGLSTPNTSVASARPQRKAKLNRPSYAEDDAQPRRAKAREPKSSPGPRSKLQRSRRGGRNVTSDSEYDYGSPLASPETGRKAIPEVVLKSGMSLADMYCDNTDEELEQVALLSKQSLRALNSKRGEGSRSKTLAHQALSDVKEEDDGGFFQPSPRSKRDTAKSSGGSSSRKRPR
ncbi:hypothetical protein IE81DRAFT_323628, partial [Ceraceosorus guamensis]